MLCSVEPSIVDIEESEDMDEVLTPGYIGKCYSVVLIELIEALIFLGMCMYGVWETISNDSHFELQRGGVFRATPDLR